MQASKLMPALTEDIQRRELLKMCRQFPYQIKSSMQIRFVGTTTYTQMLKQCGGQKFMKQLKDLEFKKFDDPIYVLEGQIQPEDVKWEIWHHKSQIKEFARKLESQIQMMNKYQSRMCGTGRQINLFYEKLKKQQTFGVPQAKIFTQFLNLVVNHDFLKKSVLVLTFVEHCMPMSLWNLKTYQQVELYKSKNFISKLISTENVVDYYLTVTADGILISTKNLLQTKIDKMIPFSNQFTFDTKVNGKDVVFQLSSCVHEAMKVNLEENYMGAINFYLGLKNALHDSDLFDPHRFNSFSQGRQHCWTKLYNDGQWYFSDLCDELKKARHQVCITDWWMTPYFLLKRPGDISDTAVRLDGVLRQLNDRGVKIFIILFREPLNMLCNDSQDAKFYLESLGRNIRVRRHPIVPQLWSHHEKCVIIDQQVGFMGGLDICFGRWDNPEHSLTNKNDNWNGGDYTNERVRAFLPGTTKNYLNSPVDRQFQPRMPWHDIGIQIKGDAVIDLARHFIQYWYFVDGQKAKDPYTHLSSIKKRYERSANYEQPDWEDTEKEGKSKKATVTDSIALCGKRTKLFVVGAERRLPQLLIEVRKGAKQGDKKLQLCRSASPWSIGAKQTEHSIHNAYQELIMESQSFIYIENQFFMGKQNKIVECLASRIRRAHNKGQNFKVVVVMPLLPGFQGQISDAANVPLRIQVHNQYYAIKRGPGSLYDRLKDLTNFNIDSYIYFFGLRGHAVLNKRPITEIIYVHSKLMIVDDKRAIIGSANINDRSLLGSRDSQLAIVIQENNGLNLNNNRPQRKDIFEFRCRIFNEHFGLSSQQTGLINSPQIWSKIIANAKNNTLIYRKIFGCYPDNTITVVDQIEERKFDSEPSLYNQLSRKIVAHAVQLPLQFMKDEDLEFKFGDKEGLAGEQTFL